MPPVTVLVPTFNNGRYIREALDSVLNQSYRDFEVIVIDDGSTDDTAQVLSGYGERVRYILQDNRGVSAARNNGMRMARGRYVAFLDADDIWEPDNLRVKVALLEQRPELGAVFSNFELFSAEPGFKGGDMTRQYAFFRTTGLTMADIMAETDIKFDVGGAPRRGMAGWIFESLFRGNFILPSASLVRLAGVWEVGGFKEELHTQEDYEYWLRMAKRYPMGFVDEALVRYRKHPAQASDQSKIRQTVSAVIGVIAEYEDEFRCAGRKDAFWDRMVVLRLELAKVFLGEGDRLKAWRCLLSNLRHRPAHFPSYGLLGLSLFPASIVSGTVRCLRQLMWRGAA